MTMTLHLVVRIYRDHPSKRDIIKTDLSLEEAQAHCQDPETTSSKCTNAAGLERTAKWGPWFDCYEEQTYGKHRPLRSPLGIWRK